MTPRISKAFLVACGTAIGVIASNPDSITNWVSAIGIVAAAAANGPKRPPKVR